jgi:hypothetical protein
MPKVGNPGLFDHVITYLPALNLYVDSTARLTPFGVLPFGDSDKPVVLTALNRVDRTPPVLANGNSTRTVAKLTVHSDGSIEGTSEVILSGISEVGARSARFGDRSYPESQIVKNLLSRFGETGSGSMSYEDPEDIGVPFSISARFELDPISNLPGPAAMRIPVGLATGALARMAVDKPAKTQGHAWPCTSRTIQESYSIEFPSGVSILGVPPGTTYHDDQIDFRSSYRRAGHQVLVERDLVVQRPSQVCSPQDWNHWRAFHTQLERDVRSQILYR